MTSQPRLANLLSALSQVSDLGMGLEPEAALRVCLFATSLGVELDLDDKTLSDAYYTALLQHSGSTAHAYETALALGDDVTTNRVGFRTNFADPLDMVRTYLTGLVEERTLGGRARTAVLALSRANQVGHSFPQATCEVAAQTARRLGLGDGVQQALLAAFEWWNGKGGPRGLRGEEIPLPTRLVHVAAIATLFYNIGGVDAARQALRARSGGYLDPSLVNATLVGCPKSCPSSTPWTVARRCWNRSPRHSIWCWVSQVSMRWLLRSVISLTAALPYSHRSRVWSACITSVRMLWLSPRRRWARHPGRGPVPCGG
jgi:HD domain